MLLIVQKEARKKKKKIDTEENPNWSAFDFP